MESWGSRQQSSWEDPKSLLGAAQVGPGSSEVPEMGKKKKKKSAIGVRQHLPLAG